MATVQQNSATSDSTFAKHLKGFKETKLCNRLEDLFRNADLKNITKIVAFGLGNFAFPMGKTLGRYNKMSLIQHTAVVVIRDLLQAKLGSKLPVYLQDPLYVEAEVELAKKYGMTIVKYGPGHQVGWNKIDKNTLVIGLGLSFPFAFIDEFEDIPAFFSTRHKKSPLEFSNPDGHIISTTFLETVDAKGGKRLLHNFHID
jgi:hypothetical protein